MATRPLSQDVLVRIKDPGVRFDIHCHTFNHDCVPNGFLGIRLPFTDRFLSFLEGVAKIIGGISKEEEITNAAYFLDIFEKECATIMAKLAEYYPASTIFCPLTMDMFGSIKGKAKCSYEDQAEILLKIGASMPGRLLPFLCLNPANKNMEQLFEKYVLTGQFWGVKIYPSLGSYPSHPRLMPIYKECVRLRIPITVHCSAGTVHSTDHHIKDNPYMVVGPDGQPVQKTKSGWYWSKADYSTFNDPKNWEPVLHFNPELVLNLGHFGGYEQWRDFAKGKDNTWVARIISLMTRYPNVFSDLAYTLFDRQVYDTIRKILDNNQTVRTHTLYGSDYYMVVMDGHFRSIKTGFEVAMGDVLMKQLSYSNPRLFLFGKA